MKSLNPHRVIALLKLKTAEEGGLTSPLLSGTRSLILQFPSPEGAVSLGAALLPSHSSEIKPGSEIETEVVFWVEEARIHAVSGASFQIWYSRVVGSGLIIDVISDS